MQAFDGGADGVEKLVAGQRDEIAPGELRPVAGEDARVLLVEGGELFVLLGKQAEEEQVGNLLDGIHRVVDAARLKDVHELIDLLTKAGGIRNWCRWLRGGCYVHEAMLPRARRLADER